MISRRAVLKGALGGSVLSMGLPLLEQIACLDGVPPTHFGLC